MRIATVSGITCVLFSMGCLRAQSTTPAVQNPAQISSVAAGALLPYRSPTLPQHPERHSIEASNAPSGILLEDAFLGLLICHDLIVDGFPGVNNLAECIQAGIDECAAAVQDGDFPTVAACVDYFLGLTPPSGSSVSSIIKFSASRSAQPVALAPSASGVSQRVR